MWRGPTGIPTVPWTLLFESLKLVATLTPERVSYMITVFIIFETSRRTPFPAMTRTLHKSSPNRVTLCYSAPIHCVLTSIRVELRWARLKEGLRREFTEETFHIASVFTLSQSPQEMRKMIFRKTVLNKPNSHWKLRLLFTMFRRSETFWRAAVSQSRHLDRNAERARNSKWDHDAAFVRGQSKCGLLRAASSAEFFFTNSMSTDHLTVGWCIRGRPTVQRWSNSPLASVFHLYIVARGIAPVSPNGKGIATRKEERWSALTGREKRTTARSPGSCPSQSAMSWGKRRTGRHANWEEEGIKPDRTRYSECFGGEFMYMEPVATSPDG